MDLDKQVGIAILIPDKKISNQNKLEEMAKNITY